MEVLGGCPASKMHGQPIDAISAQKAPKSDYVSAFLPALTVALNGNKID